MAKALIIRDKTFPAKEKLSPWLLMKVAKAHRSGDYMAIMAAQYDFLTTQVVDKAGLVSYLDGVDDITEEELDQATGNLIAEYAERPTERPSSLPDGSTPTGKPSRVVSFSKGTAKAGEASSRAGQSAAS